MKYAKPVINLKLSESEVVFLLRILRKEQREKFYDEEYITNLINIIAEQLD